jgi:hypothetical protein
VDDRLVHLVAGHAHGARVDDAGERDDRDVVVPPPMSTTMLPEGSVMGRPAPMAATMACSTR